MGVGSGVPKWIGSALPLLLFLILAAVATIVSLWWFPGRLVEQALIFSIVAFAMWLAARNTMPPHVARMLVDFRLLAIPLVLAGGTVGLAPQLIVLGWTILQPAIGLPPAPPVPGFWESAALLAIGCVFAAAFGRAQPRASAMGAYPQSWRADFPEPNFAARLDDLAKQLEKSLDTMDEETNWSPTHFIPLEAEVEVIRPDGRTLEVADLYAALERHEESRVFLLLGDPGSGKSVALRNLARQMLRAVQADGRLPVYVNLKEWRRPRDVAWSEADPPTPAELEAFILEFVRRRIRLPSHEFLNAHYNEMILRGRLFLLLDSFDEIPALMDSEDPRWLVRTLSQVVTQVLTGGTEGRGLVASRLFRQPESLGNSYCRLDIRPFSEAKALDLIGRITGTEATRLAVQQWVLTERADLAVAARNPFLLGLLVDYAQRNPGKEPENQYALYDSFFRHSIATALRDPDYEGLNASEIREVTERIAFIMFETERFGLEMPLERLEAALPGQPVARVASFLKHARLARSAPHARLFSFTHRRFNEFFLVRWFLAAPERVWQPILTAAGTSAAPPIASIVLDGRWRDALVLYAQVASTTEAARIVSHCVGYLSGDKKNATFGTRDYIERLHALRFLADTFRGEPSVLEPFQALIADFVRTGVSGPDILLQKHSVEALTLADEKLAANLLILALSSDSFWVRDTAFQACRYFASSTPEINATLRAFMLRIPSGRLLRDYSSYMEIFSIVEPFRPLRTLLRLRVAEARLGLVGLLLLPILLPVPALFLLFALPIMWINDVTDDRTQDRNAPRLEKKLQNRERAIGLWRLLRTARSAVFFYVFAVFVLLVASSIITIDVIPSSITHIIALGFNPLVFSIAPKLSSSIVLLGIANLALLFPYTNSYITMNNKNLSITVRIKSFFSALLDKIVREFPSQLLSGILLLMIVSAERWLGAWVINYLKYFSSFVGFLILALLFLAFFSWIIQGLIVRWHDYKILCRITMPNNRQTVADTLAVFRSSNGRLRYVMLLEGRANELAMIMSDTDNNWPSYGRPNYGDEASSRLARLDERWLGLGR